MVYPRYEYLQLSASVHREESCQAARGYRDVVGNKASKQLNEIKDFVDGAITSVDDYAGHWKHQPTIGKIAVLLHDFRASQRYCHEIEQDAAIHESAADDHQPTAEICVLLHDPPFLYVFYVFPVTLNVIDASAYVIFAHKKGAIFYYSHEEESESAAEF